MKDRGSYLLCPSQSFPRRPLCEEDPGRFSDFPDLNSPSHAVPSITPGQGTVAFLVKALIPPSEKIHGGIEITAAGPSPTSHIQPGVTGFPSPGYYLLINSLNRFRDGLSNFSR
jgi:hypothetical protein